MRHLLQSMTIALIMIATFASAPSRSAEAQQVRYIDTDGAWSSFQFAQNGHPVCYIASRPTEMLPANVRHGDVFLLVTDRPVERSSEVVSLMVGYSLRKDEDVTATVGKSRFRLFAEGNTAWTDGPTSDRALASAMRAGDVIRFKATSARGTNTSYTFSLDGVTAALRRIDSACQA